MGQYDPNVIIAVYAASTKYYAQRTVVISGTAYDDGRILNDPDISTCMPDDFYGIADPYDIEIVLDDVTLVSSEVRGVLVKVQVYDAEAASASYSAYGVIKKYNRDYNTSVALTVTVNESSALKTLIPKEVITTDLFHETARDVGMPINICFDRAQGVRMYNIKWDTINNHYDYLIGRIDTYGNSLTGLNLNVFRGGVLVNASEYTAVREGDGDYTDYAYVRFTVPQWDFSGTPYELYCDIQQYDGGSTASTVQLAAAYRILANDEYGLDQDMDSGVTNSWDVDVGGTVTHIVIGNGKQREAGELIAELIYPYGYAFINSDAEWEFACVNGEDDNFTDNSEYFGDNDGYYNNCTILEGPNQLGLEAYPKTLKVNYNFRLNDKMETIYDTYECSEAARSYGTDMVIDLPYISDPDNAERVIDIIWGRAEYSDYTLKIQSSLDGRAWDINEKLYAANTDISSISTDWFVVGYAKNHTTGKFEYDLRSTDDDFYNHAFGVTAITPQAAKYEYTGVVKKTIDFTASDGAVYAIDTRGYSKCYNRYRFESGALTTDTMGNDTLNSNGDPTADTDAGDYVEGSASVELDGDDYYNITDAALSANHPLKSSNSGSVAILFSILFDASIVGTTTACTITSKWAADDFGLTIQKSTADKIVATSGYDDDTYNTSMTNSTAVVADNWYGVLYCYDSDLGKEYLHIYDITGDAIHGSDIIQAITAFNMSDGNFNIGTNVVGNMDHYLVFDEPVQIEDADSIFTDPANWGPVTMTLPTSPNSMYVTAFDAYSYFNTANFTVSSSALYYGGSFGTHTYSTDEAWVNYKYVDTNIGYIKMT